MSEHDRDELLAAVDRNPDDVRSVFQLAHTYFSLGDFPNARAWYERRIELGGNEEEVYYARFRVAQAMAELGEPWPDVQEAYLASWTFRPTRAEPLYRIARTYRESQRYLLGYAFAKRAAEIPLPTEQVIHPEADIYSWRALDEQSVCGSWIGRPAESFHLTRQLLAHNDIPEGDRARMAANRDIFVPLMVASASSCPAEPANSLAGPGAGDVTVTIAVGADASGIDLTINSFLNCCLDTTRIDRVMLCHTGLANSEESKLRELYPFLEVLELPVGEVGHHIRTRFWLRLSQGWRFFAPENLITRLTAILDAEPEVSHVGINYTDATRLTGTCAPDTAVRCAPDTGRYTLTDTTVHGPAMFDTTRPGEPGPDHRRLRTATLDEVLCTALS